MLGKFFNEQSFFLKGLHVQLYGSNHNWLYNDPHLPNNIIINAVNRFSVFRINLKTGWEP